MMGALVVGVIAALLLRETAPRILAKREELKRAPL
jgi:hypothetical protein